MPKTPADIRSLCRAFTEKTVEIMGGIASNPNTPPGVRVQAIAHLWERGWGKAPTTHAGENGEGDIRVTIRHIVQGRDAPMTIEAKPVQLVTSPDLDGAA